MKTIALCYHDIISGGSYNESGFEGRLADIYKFEAVEFQRHLELMHSTTSAGPLHLTFDDGGISAITTTAPILERFGRRGYFFITTDYIGNRSFLTAKHIQELHSRGHVIGSHSCTHPVRMAMCTDDQLRDEWTRSIEVLSNIIGSPVRTASVPGGYYSDRVAEWAARAGIQTLFNSEPMARVRRVSGCDVIGRYSIQPGIAPDTVASIAAGAFAPRAQQYVYWKAKKMIKRLGGSYWLEFRRVWINRRSS
jgi:peptidoglycan/xylan/chitin deacetylase (PgdA/CDA1 family)